MKTETVNVFFLFFFSKSKFAYLFILTQFRYLQKNRQNFCFSNHQIYYFQNRSRCLSLHFLLSNYQNCYQKKLLHVTLVMYRICKLAHLTWAMTSIYAI